jgi:hypothetical protein
VATKRSNTLKEMKAWLELSCRSSQNGDGDFADPEDISLKWASFPIKYPGEENIPLAPDASVTRSPAAKEWPNLLEVH